MFIYIVYLLKLIFMKNTIKEIKVLIKDNIIIYSIVLTTIIIWDYVLSKFQNIFLLEIEKQLIITLLIVIFSLLFFYFLQQIIIYIKTLKKSNRYDIFTSYFIIFIYLLYFIFGFNNSSTYIVLIIMFVGFILYGLCNIKEISDKSESILIKDKALNKDDSDYKDFLGFEEKAKEFSNLLYNKWSVDNQVFWLIAEWWAGKTSFLDLVRKEDIIKENCIFIEFNPWYYENEKELLESFLENIIYHLKEENYYISNISKVFKNIIQLLEKNSSSIFWINFTFSTQSTLDTLKQQINESFKKIDKKIIILIDDLDRIPSKKLYEVFRIVDLCRDFYNTNYIICYDPLNFNSIDISLQQTTNISEGKISNISTQNTDNKELVRYMAKIINVYYPLTINKQLLKNYFIEIFTNKKYIDFSEHSIEAIKTWIDNLFSFEIYDLRGKYYSNIRWIKRILNNLISITQGKNSVNLFHKKTWIQFDILVKLSIISIYFNDLFIDMDNECSLDEANWGYPLTWKYKIAFSLDDSKENIKYEIFINTLDLEKQRILKWVIPLLWENIRNNKGNYDIRRWKLLNTYLNIINNRKSDVSDIFDYNVFISTKIDEYKANKSLDEIFEETKNKYWKMWTNQLVLEFEEKFPYWKWSDWKIEKWIKFIDFIINYDDFYEYSPDFDFIFYTDIANILDKSVNHNNTPENCAYIWEYFYWEWNYSNEKPIFVKFLDKWDEIATEKGKIIALRESLRLLFALDRSRGGGFYNFWQWVWWVDKLYNWLFSEFKERYIDKKINIFKFIFDWEKSIEKKWHSMIWNITYMLTHYANTEAKKEIITYFIDCFDENIEYFTKFLEFFVSDSFRIVEWEDNYSIKISDLFEILEKENLIEFANNNRNTLWSMENKHLILPSIYQWWKDIITTRKTLIEKFLLIINKIQNDEENT